MGDSSSRVPSRSTSRLGDHADKGWDRTLRPAAALDAALSRVATHSRESSIEKLPPPPPQPSSASSSIASPRLHASRRGGHALGGVPDRLVEPKSTSYGHHRQTSIVHGIQHSRNGSVASSSSSPLSPEIIAAAGVGFIAPDMPSLSRVDSEIRSLASLSSATPTPTTHGPSDKGALPPLLEAEGPGYGTAPRRTERLHSRPRRDQSRNHSHSSRQHRDERETIGDYALHVLFSSFNAQAEEKLRHYITYDSESPVETIFGPGVDPAFDQSIVALGHIARGQPKTLIDYIMAWRKGKSDTANEARSELVRQGRIQQPGGILQRRNTEPMQPGPAAEGLVSPRTNPTPQETYVLQSERLSTVSTYVLCRVLLEVISQTTLAAIGPDLEQKLEDIILHQLQNTDTSQLDPSHPKIANWNSYVQLLGVMSEINFQGLTQRIVGDVDRLLSDSLSKGSPAVGTPDNEGKIVLVLKGMRLMRLKTSPEAAWGQSCDFVLSLGQLFLKVRGQKVKEAFCSALDALLLPVASKAVGAELTAPKWAEVLSTIGPKLPSLLGKPRHWVGAFPLAATTLCVSPPESIASHWLQLVVSHQAKLKDPKTQLVSLQAVSRLVWAYLFRTSDPVTGAVRKLDEVWKLLLPVLKQPLAAPRKGSASLSEPILQIVRFIGFRYPEYCFKSIIFHHFINLDVLKAPVEIIKYEQLDPDRTTVGIRAFLAIMDDLERAKEGPPPFPETCALPPLGPPPTSTTTTERHSDSPTDSAPALAPAVTPPHVAVIPKDEDLPRPVLTSTLSDAVREHYLRFCEALGKVIRICDHSFGGRAALEEKINPPPQVVVVKTPIADAFNLGRREDRRDEQQQLTLQNQRPAFYGLLAVAIQALPRYLPTDVSLHTLLNLLCTGTTHVDASIAHASKQSLKAIARQSHAQQVAMGFARFIFEFDENYSTMSDGGMLGPDHIENSLHLYLDLLQIWLEEIKQKAKDAQSEDSDSPVETRRALQLDLSGIWAEVDQAEARGLFFLCSQSLRVRRFAIEALRLITQFDQALGKAATQDAPRLIQVLENDAKEIMGLKLEDLPVGERSRLQRVMQNGANSQSALVELCTGEDDHDTTLWYKLFPRLITLAHEKCPFPVTICRDLVCTRITHLYRTVMTIADPTKNTRYGPEVPSARLKGQTAARQAKVLAAQWKLYLIFACITLADTGPPTASAPPVLPDQQHARKGSKPSNADRMEPKKMDLRTLIKLLLPLFLVPSSSVRDSTVSALGSININLYPALLDELAKPVWQLNNEETRSRKHVRNSSASRHNPTFDQMRTEVAHVYKLTAHFLQERQVYENENILRNLVAFTADLKRFLMDENVKGDWRLQKLRTYYCGIVEQLFGSINRGPDPSRWMDFQSRRSAFSLMEEWCGFSPDQAEIRKKELAAWKELMEKQPPSERGTVAGAMENEKMKLRIAALSAMAALCAGPLSEEVVDGRNEFDVRRLLTWTEDIFNSGSDRLNRIGRRALQNLIVHNPDYIYIMEHCIGRCYRLEAPKVDLLEAWKVLESFFTVVTQVALDHPDFPCPFWKQLGLCLYMLGNDRSEIRSRAAHTLRVLEDRQQRNSKIQDFDISIQDKTQAVYKLGQFEISKRFAKGHTELAFYIFSQFTFFFKRVLVSDQRNVVAVVLPWIQSIELKVDVHGNPTAQSYMVLANLLEITIKSSGSLHNEVQALWQALATGPHPGNVRLILDFVMSLCLDRREQNFVEYAKQVVVFVASTNSAPGTKVVEFLLKQIIPKAMAPHEKRDIFPPPPEVVHLPYCANLVEALPVGTRQAGLSLGQLSMILLVDLMVSPVQEVTLENLHALFHVITVLWDHYTPLIQDQAREMLVHLIHELVISQLDDDAAQMGSKPQIETLIDLIRRRDREVVWDYDDGSGSGKGDERSSSYSGGGGGGGISGSNSSSRPCTVNRVPPGMEFLTKMVIKTFEVKFPRARDQWSQLALTWATTCPVKHLACRSFQIFRCILTSLNHQMLGAMLIRLSNTIADEDPEIQVFAMEILATLKTLMMELDAEQVLRLPQLFWAICACLDSINEGEFLEAVGMLDGFLDKVDLRSAAVQQLLSDGKPADWRGPFGGVQPLLYKGLRSSLCFEATLGALERLSRLPTHPLVSDDDGVFFDVLANFPRFLDDLDRSEPSSGSLEAAEVLIRACQTHGLASIALVLDDLISGKFEEGRQLFLAALVAALREHFLPRLEFEMVTFCMGLLTNSLGWVKIQMMRILKEVIAAVDMKSSRFSGHGPDLISPLLRLLPTGLCMEAMDVLNVIGVRMVPDSTSDNYQYLRMSMVRPTSLAVRKEYERVQSLFGIPEESGWGVPVPAKKTEVTRANIQTVFYMCQTAEGGTTFAPSAAPEVEFHPDDFSYGYFAAVRDRADSIMSDGTRTDGHLDGDLVTKLDSLDDFFDDPSDDHFGDDDGRSSRTVTEYSPEVFGSESGAELYDEQILPILDQASGSGAFQNGFPNGLPLAATADRMTLGAAFGAVGSPRPGLTGRSLTMPMGGSFSLAGEVTSDDEYNEDLFSDAEDKRPNTGGGSEGSPATESAAEGAIRPLAPSNRPGSTTQRLAAARLREGDRMGREVRPSHRGQMPSQTEVPSVPAVPDIYTKGATAGQGNVV